MKALNDCNAGHVPSYGSDPWSEKAVKIFRAHFGAQAEVFFVFNGTAANMLCLRALTLPGQAVLCSDVAHIHADESAGPEFFIQGKLRPVPSVNGKITINALEEEWIRRGDVHYAQASVLSITQPTEMGTVYSVAEVQALVEWAHARGVHVHMDGSRIGVAAESLGVPFRAFTTDVGVDMVSFGGTKNGMMGGEAVLALNPKLGRHLSVLRKQAGQLPSKSRYLAASFIAYLENDLHRRIARHAIDLAQRLAEGLRGVPGVEITEPVQANAVFAKIPRDLYKKWREDFFFYVWDEKTWECRLMLSWDSTAEDVDDFIRRGKEHTR